MNYSRGADAVGEGGGHQDKIRNINEMEGVQGCRKEHSS